MFYFIDTEKLWQLFQYDKYDPLLFGSSFFFFLFIGILLVLRLLQNKPSLQQAFILLFSLFFYYKASGDYFVVLLASVLINFGFGKLLYNTNTPSIKKLWLTIAVAVNLGGLGYFKYTNFFLESYSTLTGGEFNALDIILPLGISFYTFKALSYLFDIYLEMLEEEYSLFNFALYLMFFPNLLAGPLDKARDFLPQVKNDNPLTKEEFGKALFLIILGLLKKGVIADYIGLNLVDRIIESPLRFTGAENIIMMYGYTLQIFCDFSGYTDLAIGVALLMGYRLMDNFNYPYQATSIADFWRRWHISLSTWLLEYLFRPLQLSFRGLKIWGNVIGLFITFLLCGLWHGASWNFIVWGGVHGFMMSFAILIKSPKEKLQKKLGIFNTRGLRLLQIFITFHLITVTWLIFRAPDFEIVSQVFTQITTFLKPDVFIQYSMGYPLIIALMVLGYFFHFLPKSFGDRLQILLTDAPIWLQSFVLAVVIFIVAQFRFADIVPFIYFQF